MAQTSPATQVRTAVKAVLTTEFGSEATILDGRMHAAKGNGAANFISTYPMSEAEGANVLDQDTLVAVQVFQRWTPNVDPERVVDPTALEAWAERLREALQETTHPSAGTRGLWYFRLLRVEYETDPTGQVTRFTAYIQGIGENFAETSA